MVAKKICHKAANSFKGCWPLNGGFQKMFSDSCSTLYQLLEFAIKNLVKGQKVKFMAFLAFKSQILEHFVLNSILPTHLFWFGLSKWLYLENNFRVPNYATGLRSAFIRKVIFQVMKSLTSTVKI